MYQPRKKDLTRARTRAVAFGDQSRKENSFLGRLFNGYKTSYPLSSSCSVAHLPMAGGAYQAPSDVTRTAHWQHLIRIWSCHRCYPHCARQNDLDQLLQGSAEQWFFLAESLPPMAGPCSALLSSSHHYPGHRRYVDAQDLKKSSFGSPISRSCPQTQPAPLHLRAIAGGFSTGPDLWRQDRSLPLVVAVNKINWQQIKTDSSPSLDGRSSSLVATIYQDKTSYRRLVYEKTFGVPSDPAKDYRHWAGSPRQRTLSFAHPAILPSTGSTSQVWGEIDLCQGQNLTPLTTSFYQGVWQNPMLRILCRPSQSPVLKRTYLPSRLVPLSKRFRQMDQVGAVAGHRSHLDGSTRYQIVQPPLVDRTNVQRDQAHLWLNQCLATVSTDIGPMDNAHFPELQFAKVTGTLARRQERSSTFPYPLASAASRYRRLDRQSSPTIFPTCQHQGLLGSKISKIRAAQRGIYAYLQKSSIKFTFFNDFSSG